MKQSYETVVIFDGTLSDEAVRKENGKIEDFLKANTEFEKIDVWGKRSLAYPIKKKKSGVYHLYNYQDQSEKNIAGKIEKLLALNETVLRYLTVVRQPPTTIERKAPPTPPPAPDADAEGDK